MRPAKRNLVYLPRDAKLTRHMQRKSALHAMIHPRHACRHPGLHKRKTGNRQQTATTPNSNRWNRLIFVAPLRHAL